MRTQQTVGNAGAGQRLGLWTGGSAGAPPPNDIPANNRFGSWYTPLYLPKSGPNGESDFNAASVAKELRRQFNVFYRSLGLFNQSEHLQLDRTRRQAASYIIGKLTPDEYKQVEKQYNPLVGGSFADDMSYFDDLVIDMAAQTHAMGEQDLTERILANEGSFNSNEGGMLAHLESASMGPAARDEVFKNDKAMHAMEASMGAAQLHKARLGLATGVGGSDDAPDANTKYRAVVARIAAAKGTWIPLPTSLDDLWNIGNRSTFLNDDEQSIYDAILDLPMAQRGELYWNEGDLLRSIFNEDEMVKVADLCGIFGGAELAATTRMKLATEGWGTDEIGVARAISEGATAVQNGTSTGASSSLTDPEGTFQSMLAADVSADVVTQHNNTLEGTPDSRATPAAPKDIQSAAGRRQHAYVLRDKVIKRLGNQQGGALGRSLTDTDNTAVQVAAEFNLAWDVAMQGGEVNLEELLLLQAHFSEFERSMDSFGATLDGISGAAATIAGVAAGIVVMTLAPPCAPLIPTMLAGAGCGAAASLFSGVAIQGDDLTSDEANMLLFSGALSGGLSIAGEFLALKAVAGMQTSKLGQLAIEAGVKGGKTTKAAALGTIGGSLEGAIGDVILTTADLEVWRGVTWSKMAQITAAAVRGGIIGGLSGGALGGVASKGGDLLIDALPSKATTGGAGTKSQTNNISNAFGITSSAPSQAGTSQWRSEWERLSRSSVKKILPEGGPPPAAVEYLAARPGFADFANRNPEGARRLIEAHYLNWEVMLDRRLKKLGSNSNPGTVAQALQEADDWLVNNGVLPTFKTHKDHPDIMVVTRGEGELAQDAAWETIQKNDSAFQRPSVNNNKKSALPGSGEIDGMNVEINGQRVELDMSEVGVYGAGHGGPNGIGDLSQEETVEVMMELMREAAQKGTPTKYIVLNTCNQRNASLLHDLSSNAERLEAALHAAMRMDQTLSEHAKDLTVLVSKTEGSLSAATNAAGQTTGTNVHAWNSTQNKSPATFTPARDGARIDGQTLTEQARNIAQRNHPIYGMFSEKNMSFDDVFRQLDNAKKMPNLNQAQVDSIGQIIQCMERARKGQQVLRDELETAVVAAFGTFGIAAAASLVTTMGGGVVALAWLIENHISPPNPAP